MTEPNRKPRDWQPHIWEGCDAFAWLRLLTRNRFAVSPSLWYVAAITTPVSATHTALRLLQEVLYGRAIRATPITHAPVFILGHWRAGTTLLHELLVCDPRHGFPNTYQCMEPNHFLLTEDLFRRYANWLLPERRPVDNMQAGWERPQEDEFALCMMGQPSPYLTVAFPNHPPADPEFLDFVGVSPRRREQWKRALFHFLQTLTYKDPRRLILKSPTHTARIPVLLELFPDARFVHIVRNPYHVYPSTINLWKKLFLRHGLQVPNYAGLEEMVFDNFNRLYAGLEAGRGLVDSRRFHEVRYEDLTRDPTGELRKVYTALELGEFEPVEQPLAKYLAQNSKYEKNRFELSATERAKIEQHWGHVIRQYGY